MPASVIRSGPVAVPQQDGVSHAGETGIADGGAHRLQDVRGRHEGEGQVDEQARTEQPDSEPGQRRRAQGCVGENPPWYHSMASVTL